MKSKYKLKIKEISMRLKNGSVLLLGILCLFAVAPIASATDWTDPTCAAPGCNTDGPIWVNPDSQQDATAGSSVPMINISDSRTSGVPDATIYVESLLTGKPAIYGYGLGSGSAAYGGYFKADFAPGLYVSGGVTFAPLALDPAGYQAQGLLYYSSDTGTYRYYDGGDWYNLPLWSKGTALGFEDSIYHSVAAGTGNGVAIKSGDLTGPNEDYTLDVLRVTQSTSDRAIYGRLTIDAGWGYYASGFMGGYDDSGNAVGVRGKVSDHMGGAQKNYGGYFEAAGGLTGTAGVYGLASTAGTASPTYGGYFQSNGVNGIGVYATGPSYGLEAVGTNGTGIHAVGSGDGVFAEGDTAVYGWGQNFGAQFWTDSAVIDGAIGVSAISQSSTNGVGLYAEGNHAVHGNSGFSNGRGVYGQHQGAAVGYGVYGTSSGSSGYGVYGAATGTGAVTNYGGYFITTGNSGRAVYGNASTTSGLNTNYGGFFTASGGNGIGVYAVGGTSGAAIAADGVMRMKDVTAPGFNVSGYGQVYVNSDKLYFRDDNSNVYDLTGGGSGTIEDGTANGQTPFWNHTAGEWQHTETSEMVWDDTNKRLGVGVAAPSYKFSSVTATASDRAVYAEASANSGTAVYGNATDTSNPNYGGRFVSSGWAGYGVHASATNTGATANYGGYFSASGTSGVGVYGTSSNYGGRFNSTGSTGTGVYSTVVSGSASGTSYAGRFETDTTSGRAVYGYVTGSGSPYGGYFYVNSSPNTGSAVYGYNASNSSATAYAGHFVIASGTGTAVRAENTSATGYAGYFDGRVYTSSKFLAPTIDSATSPSFTWYADDNTGLFRVSGGDTIGFTTNGSEKMRIDSAGNVGIGGATTAERLLHVKSSDAVTLAVTYAQRLSHVTSGTTDVGFGVGIEFELENASNINKISGAIESKWVDPTNGSEDAILVLKTTNNSSLVGSFAINQYGYPQITGPEDVEFLYFGGTYIDDPANLESLNWDGSVNQFYLTDDLNVDGGVVANNSSGVGMNVNGSTESARFTGAEVVILDGSDVIGYATGAGDLFVSDALEVDGLGYFGSNIYVGQAGAGAVDNYVYFDAGVESLMWDNTNGRFSFSDDLYTTSSIESATTLRAGGIIYGDGNLYLDNDFNSATDVIFFSTTTATDESLMWDSGTDSRFEFSDDVYISNTLVVAGNINTTTSGGAVYGHASGSFGLYSNRTGSDGNLLRFDRDGVNVGMITVASGTVSYGAFTGSHYVILEDNNIERGQLIHLTGNNSYQGKNETGEMIYGAKISEMANDPAIIGSFFSVAEDMDGVSWAQSVGNGDMWVVDNGSNLEIGDYLISSDVPGHAMKVTDEYPVAYVVARVAENVDWSKVEEKTEDGIKHKKISVLFESFILNQDLGLAFDKNQNLDDLSWFYAMEAKTPVEKAIQTQKQQLDALETKVEMIEKDGCSNNEAILMETIEKLEARIEALEGQSVEPVKTSFWSKLW